MDIDESISNSWWPYIIALIVGLITTIRSYVGGKKCPCDDYITNKIVLITGSSSGLGLETAKELARRGSKIILTYRNLEKSVLALEAIKKIAPYSEIDVRYLDISNTDSIKEFVKNLSDYKNIDVLINNVGIMFHPYQITDEDFEIHFVTNYLGHFLLTHLLLPKLKSSKNARIINLCAQAYSSGNINFDDLNLINSGSNKTIQAFTQSKLCLVLMTKYMSKILKGNVTINAVDPGLVRNTDHMRNSPLKTSIPIQISVWPWMWLFLKTPSQGIQSIIYAAVDPQLKSTTGKYFSDCEIKEFAKNCDGDVDEKLYKKSCELLSIKPII